MAFTDDQIADRARELGPWYHEIEIVPGFLTPSVMLASKPIWEMIRRVRSLKHYDGLSVLDLGSMEGMWAFEAEKAGASVVVAADIYQGVGIDTYERFMLARSALHSRVLVVPNADVHRLHDRLDTVREHLGVKGGFDVIQCLGLLYHVQNPLLALRQMRACLAPGGVLLLETACYCGGGGEPVMRYNSDNAIYCDPTTYWAPNWPCLIAMLYDTGFSILADSVQKVEQPVNRVCLLAIASHGSNHGEGLGLIA